MTRNFLLIVLLGFIIRLVSCKEEELPSGIVFGEPDAPIVFDLRVIDPLIESKNIEFTGHQFGTIKLVNNTFVVFYPESNFENDYTDIIYNGKTIGSVVFISTALDSQCKVHGKSFNIEVKKNSGTISQSLSPVFCKKNSGGTASNFIVVAPIPGVVLSSQLEFTPAPDFVGSGEIIYETGSGKTVNSNTIYEAELVVCGLIQITVTE